MDELLFQYADTFDENFPIFMFMGTDEKEIEKIIQKCLDDGIPYEPESEEDVKY